MTENIEEKSEKKKKVGVFVCHCGGNISDYVDVKDVAVKLKMHDDVEVSEDFIFMCSNSGQELIKEKMEKNDLTHVVVASCSPNLHEKTFQKVVKEGGLNQYQFQHVNIREQNSWVHGHGEMANATSKAIRQVNAGVGRVLEHESLENIKKKTVQIGIVVGAGVSGLTSALDIARSGIPVEVFEKSPFIGGRVLQLDKLFPTEADAKQLVNELIAEVEKNENIKIHLNSTIIEGAGAIGEYNLKVRQVSRGVMRPHEKMEEAVKVCPIEVPNEFDYGLTTRKAIYKSYPGAIPEEYAIDWENCTKCGKCVDVVGDAIVLEENPEEIEIKGGTIIMATGFDPYEPEEGEYGYKTDTNVITLPQLIRIMDGYDNKDLIINNKRIKKIALIHCVGSRQIEDVHTPKDGHYNTHCSRVCCTATLQSANELKRKFPGIDIYDLYRDIRAYGDREYYYEEANKNNVIFIKHPDDEVPVIKVTNNGLTITTHDILSYGIEVEVDVDLVVLATAMVPRQKAELISLFSLPTGNNKFLLEAHPKLRPVESSSDGFYLAGAAQTPMDVSESVTAASAAAAKATGVLSKEILSLSPFIAEVNLDLCSGAADCLAECEYHAITLHDDGGSKKAVIDPALCTGCGACVPACKQDAIVLHGFLLDQIHSDIEGFIKGVNGT